jgi:hypothetical protein
MPRQSSCRLPWSRSADGKYCAHGNRMLSISVDSKHSCCPARSLQYSSPAGQESRGSGAYCLTKEQPAAATYYLHAVQHPSRYSQVRFKQTVLSECKRLSVSSVSAHLCVQWLLVCWCLG